MYIINKETYICRLPENNQDEIIKDLSTQIYALDISSNRKNKIYNKLITGQLKDVSSYIDISKYIGKNA